MTENRQPFDMSYHISNLLTSIGAMRDDHIRYEVRLIRDEFYRLEAENKIRYYDGFIDGQELQLFLVKSGIKETEMLKTEIAAKDNIIRMLEDQNNRRAHKIQELEVILRACREERIK
jgi:hypothetical protein